MIHSAGCTPRRRGGTGRSPGPGTRCSTRSRARSPDGYPPDFGWQFRAELIAAGVGILLTVGLLVWRRWGEATYVGLQIVAFTTSFWFFSVPRATLLWWPLFLALAAITMRWRWTLWTYIAVSAPLMIVWTVAYTSGGKWTG